MTSRRKFIQSATLAGAAVITGLPSIVKASELNKVPVRKPVVLSTWKHGMAANEAAWKILAGKGRALDAVEKGVNVTEADFTNKSVGLGGLPDRDGKVTLDASIMNEKGECGSVAFLQHILHPVSVARMVMEKTPHVMLAGEGALRFALDNGFKKESGKLSEQSEKAWKEWLKTSNYKPVVNIENHDTIGMIALDEQGNLSGSCTTSGLAYKIHGRVGDSPIIGAGMYVDNEVGAACATGKGEAVMKVCGSFLVVELMRQGMSPDKACREAINRLIQKNPDYKDLQVGFLALNKQGETGAYAVQKGFDYAVCDAEGNKLIDSEYFLK
ncbi:MAG TPA: N(4)-(beta-N-acetylglucosaminyl)-L-asparaginase [Bacteroidia bacterium]|jgi:N4-(beta-N-acetylglucosaminyl)-L-asparaginase|nr:N(4)-(beta-N-acetylglucosaminyl)-L-asparaginase [Bacteroidia bacterium]